MPISNPNRTILLLCACLLSFCTQAQDQIDNALSVIQSQLTSAQSYSVKTSYPRTIRSDGTVLRVSAGDWTCGFFPGELWLMYEYTKDPVWRDRAREWTAGIEGQKNNTSTHDVGFMTYSSFGNGVRLGEGNTYRDILVQAAQSLATRYSSVVKAIQSWSNNPAYTYPVIIDNMLNLELLFYASKVTGDQTFYNIAVQHALTTMNNHFRADNSSFHVVDFDPATGSVIKKDNYQGLNQNSAWARGQAWGLYGFTMCYRETGDQRFLDHAKKIADFILTNIKIPTDGIPYWDYDATDFRDASAASIAASGLLELCEYAPDKAAQYYAYGNKLLTTLINSTYFASANTNANFLLKHSVGNKPKNSEVDVPVIYTDYYFLQALLRYRKPAPFVSASSTGSGEITLSWNKSSGASSYNVKRRTSPGEPYTTIANVTSSLTFKDAGLQNGTTYYYVVAPVSYSGEGISSQQVSAIPTIPQQYPLNISISGSGSVTKNPDQSLYNEGSSVTLTATPASGFQFNGWSGDQSSNSNPATVTVNSALNITASFISVTTAPLITNLTSASSRAYDIVPLSEGIKYYTDRDYTVTTVPSAITQATLIRTPNDDKNSNLSTQLSFYLSRPATVYVAYDPRGTSIPSWLTTFQQTSDQLVVSDTKITGLKLYSRQFDAGTISLGGNLASPASGALTGYVVIVKEQVTTSNYTVNLSSSGGGSVSKSPDQATYPNGSAVTLTATPISGYQFSGWSGDASGTTNPLSITVNSNKNITANFSQTTNTPLVTNLSANSSNLYALDKLITGVMEYTDRNYDVTTVPDYLNNEVMVRTPNNDKTNTSTNLVNFTLTRPAIIYIAYDPRATSIPGWLTSFTKLNDKIGVNDSQISGLDLYSKSYAAGTVTIGGNLASPAAGANTNYFIVAKEQTQAATYTVSATSGGNGTVTKNPDQASYNSGTSVTLTATPFSGYQFSGWSGDASGTTNPLTITVTSNKNITANFIPRVYYTVAVQISGNGSVTKSPEQANYSAGSTVTLTATPATGYQFDGWTGDASGTINPLSISVNSNKNITASFSLIPPPPLFSNIVSNSGKFYEVRNLNTGVEIYTDKNWTVTGIPSNLANAKFISSPMADAGAKSKSFLDFNLGSPATIYIAYDSRANSLPSWLSGWQLISNALVTINDGSGSSLRLYKKDYSAGAVTLGGNMSNPAKGAQLNYIIIGVPTGNALTLPNFVNSPIDLGQSPEDSPNFDLQESNGSIYPNPMIGSGYFLNLYGLFPDHTTQVALINLDGQILEKSNLLSSRSGRISQYITLKKKYPPGVYLVTVAQQKRLIQLKIVIR